MMVREDAALACMAVAAVRFARCSWRPDVRPYGIHCSGIRLDEIVGAEAAELAQRAREHYEVRSSNADEVADWCDPARLAWETDREHRERVAEYRERNAANIDGLRWSEAASLLMDGWEP